MIRVLFICHGNICRSPMAEFVFKDFIKKRHVDDLFFVALAATSTEELGNPVHYGTRNKLASLGISTAGKYAVQLRRSEYDKYDYLIGMEQRNVANMRRIAGGDPEGKMYNLLDFTGHPRDIADPWYTGDFDATYDDILEGCTALLDQLLASQEQTILTL